MATIRAIYENGVFRPLQPVQLPDRTTVEFEPARVAEDKPVDMQPIYDVLSRRYRSGHSDTAAQHDEHQPL